MSAVGAKRRALHGAEHRSSMDRVMAGASAVVPIVVIFRARTGTWCSTASPVLDLRQHSALHRIQYELTVDGQIFPEETGPDCPDNPVPIGAQMSA